MLGELSLPHILIVLVVVLLVFGAKRLPEIGASMGKGIREFKKSLSEIGNAEEEHQPATRDEPRRLQTTDRVQTSERKAPKRLSQ